jgi:ABC-type branched-chain amino acid transport systems, periplasmic component
MRKCIALFACLALAVVSAAAQNVIKIGAHWPLADPGSAESAKAAQLAVDEINKSGGVAGKQLQLVVVDDEMKGDKGVAAIERLVNNEKVDLLFGGYSSGVEAAIIPTLKKYGIVTVATGAASSGLVENPIGPSPDSDFYFHLHPWDYQQSQSEIDGFAALAQKYPSIKAKKLFIAYEEGAFGSPSFAGWKAILGPQGWTVDGASFKSAAVGGSDYSGALQAAKDFKPDMFWWIGYAPDALPLLEQAKAMKFSPPMYLGAPPAWPADFASSPLGENVMLFGMWSPAMNKVSPASKKFYDSYLAAYKVAPTSYFAALSYSGIYILRDAIQKAGGVDKAKLIAALEQTSYVSPLGEKISFTPSKLIKHQGIKSQKILQWQKGSQEILWPFEAASSTIVYPLPAWK